VPGEDETPHTGASHQWAKDDPYAGIPIEVVPPGTLEEGEGGGE
jgi:hypothetical protein